MKLPVYLIGARGCGKTTVGQALATALGYAFFDTDRYLQQKMQRSVAQIVAAEGWEKFRQYEADTLKAVSASATVIATGGGMVLAESNRRYMRQRGQVIWLNVSPEMLSERLQQQPDTNQRPTLTGRPVDEEIGDILRQRMPLYRLAAHHEINAMLAPDKIVERILTIV